MIGFDMIKPSNDLVYSLKSLGRDLINLFVYQHLTFTNFEHWAFFMTPVTLMCVMVTGG